MGFKLDSGCGDASEILRMHQATWTDCIMLRGYIERRLIALWRINSSAIYSYSDIDDMSAWTLVSIDPVGSLQYRGFRLGIGWEWKRWSYCFKLFFWLRRSLTVSSWMVGTCYLSDNCGCIRSADVNEHKPRWRQWKPCVVQKKWIRIHFFQRRRRTVDYSVILNENCDWP